MADTEGPSGVGAIDGRGARAMLGGSLPPRKRLLAGLKQNGWLAASSGGYPAATVMAGVVGGNSLEGGGMAAQEGSGGGQVEIKEGCVSCGLLESGASRRLKRNGVVHRLCSTCAVSCHKNQNCPICLVVYPDVKDPSVWLQCCRCQRAVHMECEKTRNSSVQLGCSPYLCPECVQAKKFKEMSNGSVLGTRAKGCGGRVGVNCSVEAGICASSAAAECSSPCSKKARVHRELRIVKDGDTDASVERICSEVKTGLGRKGVSSQEAAAAAAAAAAATACRAAQVAKALAAAKAAAAVKAAAAAKAALDVAALAARAEAQARAELRRNSGSSDIATPKHEAAHVRIDRGEKAEVKVEGEEAPGGTSPNIDDEELARQLHRAINSSPRISRNITHMRRKAVPPGGGGKPAAENARSWPRTQQPPSPSSEHRQAQCAVKQQQTRPRSLVGGHKEVKRLDSRVMKKPDETCHNSAHQPLAVDALKSEPADSSTISHVQQDFSPAHHEYPCAPLDMTKGEADRQFGGVTEVYSGGELSHDMRLSDAEVSQAAAMLDEVLMSEEAEQQAAEGSLDDACLAGYGDGDGARVLESAVAWQVEANAGMLENQDGGIAINAEAVSLQSCASVPFPSDDTSRLETCVTPADGGAVVINGQWSTDGSGSNKQECVEDEAQRTSEHVAEEGSQSSDKEEFPIKVGSGSQEVDGSNSQSAAVAQVQVLHQGVAKGKSGGGKGFANGRHLSSPPSIST